MLIPIVATLLMQTAPTVSFAPGREESAALFLAIEGSWSCAGAFANGKPLASDLTFTATLDGRGLHYSHVDRAPNVYRQQAVWGHDKETGQMVSLAFTAFPPEPMPSAAMYQADSVTKNSVRLIHKRLLSDPFAPNRFTYTVEGTNKLNMVWEVSRKEGEWKMGDYLNCDRRPAAS
jgi:hypothetical protein